MLVQNVSATHSIADAVVVKDQDVFLVVEPSGNVPLDDGRGCGLHFHDCRFLDGYEVRVGGRPLVPLAGTQASPRACGAARGNSHLPLIALSSPAHKVRVGR
ncbi:MAG TPA: glycogen debranching N-terminal domain-containing protein [Methylomirabilota bacterium]|nr:glycogen debranching N-terminal domain-containing protein [Methylomirabilota bacterium]